jgi:hypothetical protein
MSTAIAAYLVAAGLRIRFSHSNQEAANQAAELWRLITERLQAL